MSTPSPLDIPVRSLVDQVTNTADRYAQDRAPALRLRLLGVSPDDPVAMEHYIALEIARAWIKGHLDGLISATVDGIGKAP